MEIPPLEKRELHVAYKITFWYTEDKQMAKYRKLSRTSSQRKALLRGQVTAL